MNTLEAARFTWLLRNEMLDAWTRLMRYTIGGIVIGLLIYLVSLLVILAAGGNGSQMAPYQDAFPAVLLIGGALFTGTIFRNLHNPLEDIHYLMTPVSNLERFVTKYLVSGPLFVLYVLLAYVAFELLAQSLGRLMFGTAGQFLNITDPHVTDAVTAYLQLHVLVFAGAVIFRRYTLLKTMATYALLMGTGLLLVTMTLRMKFAGLFEGGEFAFNEETEVGLNLPFEAWHFDVFWLLVCLWIVYLAYLWLLDYEV